MTTTAAARRRARASRSRRRAKKMSPWRWIDAAASCKRQPSHRYCTRCRTPCRPSAATAWYVDLGARRFELAVDTTDAGPGAQRAARHRCATAVACGSSSSTRAPVRAAAATAGASGAPTSWRSANDLRRRPVKAKSITVEQVRLLRESRGATNSTLQGMKEGALRRAIRRLDYPDLPRARQQQLLAISRDDAGQVQPGALARALIEVSAMRRRLGATTHCAGVPAQRVVRPKALVGAAPGLPAGEPVVAPAAGLATAGWVALGPGNIGGRTRSIVIASRPHPTTMWAGSVGGGVWRTADGGDLVAAGRRLHGQPRGLLPGDRPARRRGHDLRRHRRGLRQPRRAARRRHLPHHRRRHLEAAAGDRGPRTSTS